MKLFTASQFTPTKFDTAEDKAKFANHFVRFVESDFRSTLFPKWFYTRLSMTFGHIAHYNQSGFYSEFFESTMDKVRFLEQTRLAGCYGSPEHTYCDVERVIVKWVRDSGIESLYRERLAEEIKAKEMAKGNVAECVAVAAKSKLLRFDITPEAADLIADALDIMPIPRQHYISPDDDDMCRLASDLAILFRQS